MTTFCVCMNAYIFTTSTSTSNVCGVLTRRQRLLYTADSKAIRDIKTPSDRSAPLPSRMYRPNVWPGRLTISTSCITGKHKHKHKQMVISLIIPPHGKIVFEPHTKNHLPASSDGHHLSTLISAPLRRLVDCQYSVPPNCVRSFRHVVRHSAFESEQQNSTQY